MTRSGRGLEAATGWWMEVEVDGGGERRDEEVELLIRWREVSSLDEGRG